VTSRRRRKARDMIGRGTVSPVQMQRERLFGALGIIAVTRQACETMEDPTSMMDAREVVYDVVNDVAGAQERLVDEDKNKPSVEGPADRE
jgi:hypothetical protein